MNTYIKGLLCCLLATVSWGAMFPVMTHALIRIDPFNFTTIRYGIAGIAFALLLLFSEGRPAFRLKNERWGWPGCSELWDLPDSVSWCSSVSILQARAEP